MESETNSGSNSDEFLNGGGGDQDCDDDVSSYEPSEDDATEYDELFRLGFPLLVICFNCQLRVPIAKAISNNNHVRVPIWKNK